MFTEFQNQTWTTSVSGATITTNTDESIDGSSRKIVFTAADAYANCAFTSFTGSSYEEVSFWIYQKQTLSQASQFKVTINSTDYEFTRLKEGWNHILIDCSSWGAITSLRITSLVADLIIFFDYAGYRKVSYESMDLDIVEALKSKISLSYGVTTTLAANVSAGAKAISLTSKAYINNTSLLSITDGVNTEQVYLAKQDGTLRTALTYGYASGSTVTVLCPTLSEENLDYEPNPVCGITILGTTSEKEFHTEINKSVTVDGVEHISTKLKRYLGSLQLLIYIDCSSKKKLLGMSRQFDNLYGTSFKFLLDGQFVTANLDNIVSNIDIDAGQLPRKAYFYTVEPQPITVAIKRELDTINITIDSEEIA